MDADYATDVPALLVTVGPHELDYGALATVRTLGRVGVAVYATLDRAGTPLARSRYLTEGFVWPTTGREPESVLVRRVRDVCARIGRPAVAIAGDDESAVLLAAHRDDLADVLLLPAVDPGLPGRLADKAELARVCAQAGVDAPMTAAPRSWPEVEEFAASCPPPWIVKNPRPFGRLTDPSVARTAVADDAADLRDLLGDWQPGQDLLLQEFVPARPGDDWYVEALVGDDDRPVVAFTGRKVRAYPPGTGIGTASRAEPNPALRDLTLDLCRRIGYRGPADLDWRLDRRDGRYRLVDFNPRRGAQFRLFVTTAGIDVVRALHLSMTGRDVPPGEQVFGREHVVGVLDHRARLAGSGQDAVHPVDGSGGAAAGPDGREGAWLAADDPAPALATMGQLGVAAVRSAGRRVLRRGR